jgi:hypothetical protein
MRNRVRCVMAERRGGGNTFVETSRFVVGEFAYSESVRGLRIELATGSSMTRVVWSTGGANSLRKAQVPYPQRMCKASFEVECHRNPEYCCGGRPRNKVLRLL